MVAASLRDVKFENVGRQVETKKFARSNEFIDILTSRRTLADKGKSDAKLSITDLETLLQQANTSPDLPALFGRYKLGVEEGNNLLKYFAYPDVETTGATLAASGAVASGSTQGKLVAKWPRKRHVKTHE